MSHKILISEVGPRDGLQNCKGVMPTAVKKRWIKGLYDAGVREIEVGSFVPPKLFPQLADTAEIVAYAKTLPGLRVLALVPNLRGAQAAIAAMATPPRKCPNQAFAARNRPKERLARVARCPMRIKSGATDKS